MDVVIGTDWSMGPQVVRPCRHCGVELAHLPPTAVFCPHCGGAMALSPREAIVAGVRRVPPTIWDSIGRFVLRCFGMIGDSKYVGERDRSRMVTGYGKAMFNLGWRYERRQNLPEAVRCYFKSSKLGNPDATARLNPARDELKCGDEISDPPTRVMPLWREWREWRSKD